RASGTGTIRKCSSPRSDTPSLDTARAVRPARGGPGDGRLLRRALAAGGGPMGIRRPPLRDAAACADAAPRADGEDLRRLHAPARLLRTAAEVLCRVLAVGRLGLPL